MSQGTGTCFEPGDWYLFYTEWIRYYVEPPRGMKTLISARGGNHELADCPMPEDLSSRDE